MNPPRKMPDWAYNQMLDGLQKLLVLRLQGSPPADTITALAAIWEEALMPYTWAFNLEYDRTRLPRAFNLLIQQAERWVQPAQLIRLIPPRLEQPLQITQKPMPRTAEQSAKAERNRQAVLAKIAQITHSKRIV